MSNLERRLYNIEAFLNDIEGKYLEIGRSINDLRREINSLKQEAHLAATAKPSGSRVIKNMNPAAYGEPNGFSAFTVDQLVNATKAQPTQQTSQSFASLQSQIQSQVSSPSASPPKTAKKVKDFNPPKIEKFEKTAPKISKSSGGGGITAEYQNLVGMMGMQAKQARESFIKKYRIFGVTCANIDERLQNIKAVPVFEADDEPSNSQLWLVPAKNKYLAFLNPVKGYSLDVHLFAGFRDIFKSNYKEETGTYDEFKSFKPAAFVKSGKLFRCETFGEIVF